MRKSYAADLSDSEWTYLRSRLPELPRTVRTRTHCLRDVFDAIFCVLKTGCQWRLLSHDFPPWQTVFYHVRRFRLSGMWHELRVTAESADGVVMAVEHAELPLAAVQVHPESILSLEGDLGMRLIRNVVVRLEGSASADGTPSG